MTDTVATSITVPLAEGPQAISALLDRPPNATRMLLLAHGAGAGMQHAFMQALTHRLNRASVAVLRYQFPYTEAGRRRPDHATTLTATVRAAAAAALEMAGPLPLFAGGKSMGGRMTSLAMADQPLRGVRGIVFVGFPLHPADKPGTSRAKHLADVSIPMLFLNGTRDKLADLDLLRPICANLGERAHLHVVEGADHGFHVLKRSGRTDEDVLDELGSETRMWMGEIR